jgi:hypothetical protein
MDVFVAGKTESDHGCIDDTVDLLIESLEIQDKHEKGKELEEFFYQSCDTYRVQEIFKPVAFHQQAGILRYAKERKKLQELKYSQRSADA